MCEMKGLKFNSFIREVFSAAQELKKKSSGNWKLKRVLS